MIKVPKNNSRILFLSPTVEAGWQKQSHITDFKLLEKIGSGSFGTVHKVMHKKSNRIYAIKEIKKATLDSKKLLEHARTEVKIMYKLNHPNIIKLHNHFEDDISIFLVLEFAAKGQLFTVLKTQPDTKFSQSVASQYIRQITQGIKQIHSNGIMHRDLKLQNILVDEQNCIKIADFGWSHFVDLDKRTTYCGTLDYLAPQMVQKGHKHDQKVDIWSIGVLIYELTTGYSPFSCMLSGNDISIQNVKKNIKNVAYKLPKGLSGECEDLIKKILKLNPQERLPIEQILCHQWIKKTKNETQKFKSKKDWMQALKSQMKQMFPQDTIQPEIPGQKKQFSKEQIYKYTRPDSIINLKPKKKKQDISSSPIMNKPDVSLATTSSKTSQESYQSKRISELQFQVSQLEFHKKKDQEEIMRLREQLFKSKNNKDIQIQSLMDQIKSQNKNLQVLTFKLSESERKLLQFEKKQSKF